MVRYRFARLPLPKKPKPFSVPVLDKVKVEVVEEEEKPFEIKTVDGKRIEVYKYKL